MLFFGTLKLVTSWPLGGPSLGQKLGGHAGFWNIKAGYYWPLGGPSLGQKTKKTRCSCWFWNMLAGFYMVQAH